MGNKDGPHNSIISADYKFILEGLLTVCIGAVLFWIIVDFTDDATFLSPLEKHVVIARLKSDGRASYRCENFKRKYFWGAYKDYTGMLMYM